MSSPWSELRFAARRLRRAPSFATAVVLVLALGVGTTTAVFSLVTPVAVFAVAFVATWIPARHAAALHPSEALRSP